MERTKAVSGTIIEGQPCSVNSSRGLHLHWSNVNTEGERVAETVKSPAGTTLHSEMLSRRHLLPPSDDPKCCILHCASMWSPQRLIGAWHLRGHRATLRRSIEGISAGGGMDWQT